MHFEFACSNKASEGIIRPEDEKKLPPFLGVSLIHSFISTHLTFVLLPKANHLWSEIRELA